VAQQSNFGSLNISSTPTNKFYLIVNDIKINDTPTTNLRLQRMDKLFYSIRIEFENKSTPTIAREKFFICNKMGLRREFSYQLLNIGNNIKLRFIKMTAINAELISTQDLSVYNLDEIEKNNSVVNEPKKNTVIIDKQIVWDIKSPDNWLCQNEWPMWKSDYEKQIERVKAEKNEEQQLLLAKTTVAKNCMHSDQIVEIGLLIKKEDLKLEFAEFSFPHTIDTKNYYRVKKIFNSKESIEKLMKFVSE
jgi:hypothetical protein